RRAAPSPRGSRLVGAQTTMSALWGLLRKEMYHIRRDRRTLTVLILLPVVLVIMFGAAIRTDVKNVRLVIVDPQPDELTLALRNRFMAGNTFKIVAVSSQTTELERAFQLGDAHEAVKLEPDFTTRLARGLPARVSIIADATEPNTGNVVQSYALAVIQDYERELQSRASAITIVPEIRMRFNPTR